MKINSTNCMGCGLCAVECPKHAISFTDETGFIFPVIDESACVDCGKCFKVCKKDLRGVNKDTFAFSAWSTDSNSRYYSTSGGVGYEIAKYLLGQGYVYLGIEMDATEQRAVAYTTSEVSQLDKSRGSKYIPTHMYPAIQQIRQKEKILIIDVPCHIGAYDAYLKEHGMRDQAILVDMFCAGPCNSLILKKNIAELCTANEKSMDDLQSVKFRSKKHFGWSSNVELAFQDGFEIYQDSNTSDFFKMFYSDALHPDACYLCNYDRTHSFADLRIGDYWGTKHRDNREGISAVLAFTEAGRALLEELGNTGFLHIEPTHAEDIFEAQLNKPQRKPRHRDRLLAELPSEKSLKEIQNGVMKQIFLERRIRMKIKRTLNATKLGFCVKMAKKIRK